MNIMILSPGRRVEIIQYFKSAVSKKGGQVFTLDMSPYAPALYEGDKAFVVEKNFNNTSTYIEKVIDICRENKVGAIITLIDPELLMIAENKAKFLAEGVYPIVSNINEINFTLDKYSFSRELSNRVNVVPTYKKYNEVFDALKKRNIEFPLFAKIKNGSGSIGVGKILNEEELETYKDKSEYIFQPFIKHKEYGVDVYFDMIDGRIKSLFIKEKISMRAGETDKAISVYRKDIVEMVMKLENLEFKGPVDIDIFEDRDGILYMNEINPRFGGGYPLAYNAGVNFIENILTNLSGMIVEKNIGNYKEGLVMMKHNSARFIDVKDIKKSGCINIG